MPKDPNELGALWVKTSARGEYMTGTINGEAVVVFRNNKQNDKQPDWRVLKSKPRDEAPPRPKEPESEWPEDDPGF